MAVLLGLASALCYGTSDFVAGAAGRRADPALVAVLAQPFGLVAAIVAVAVLPAHHPGGAALAWGALSGLGSGLGTIALYRGLATGRMSVVAPLSALLTIALPVLVGVGLGDRLSALAWVGVALAPPAVLLVSVHAATGGGGERHGGAVAGLAAGVAFALLFIGLARAGTGAGAWPLVPGQAVAVAVVAAFAASRRDALRARTRGRAVWREAVAAGVLAGVANLAYLAATGHGQLAVVAVLAGLYPAATVLLARAVLHERWGRVQAAGLLVAAAAIALISAG
ncbi:MAG TPA: EamA family transporter [Gaiellaceae bacterium]